MTASTNRAPRTPFSYASLFRQVCKVLASLKITVTCFLLAIFLIVVGTLAQVDKDIWQVVDEYFRATVTWVDLKVFCPPSFFPGLSVPYETRLPGGYVLPLGFYFPGGWLIGGVLAVNLLAAHASRFVVQARGTRLKLGWAVIGVGSLLTWLVVAYGANTDGEQARAWLTRAANTVGLGASSLRILWQLCKGQLAALVLLLGCILLFRKRAGLVLLHGGIGLMMLGEVLTGLTAVEGHMQMAEGESTNYVRHGRALELAIVDRSHNDRDVVIAVPEIQLLGGGKIQHEDLPFDIKQVHFLKNSDLRPRARTIPIPPPPASA